MADNRAGLDMLDINVCIQFEVLEGDMEPILNFFGMATAPSGYDYLAFIFRGCMSIFTFTGILFMLADIIKSLFRTAG